MPDGRQIGLSQPTVIFLGHAPLGTNPCGPDGGEPDGNLEFLKSIQQELLCMGRF